jgi:exoribonuclease II
VRRCPSLNGIGILRNMIRADSLALYKNKPVLVVEIRDRIEIRLEDGSLLRVRDKDIVLLHDGPVKKLPQPAQGGDFETARKMLSGSSPASLPWGELSELVFGEGGPEQVLACWMEASRGLLFRIEEGLPFPLSDADAAKEAQKRARKESEEAERVSFVRRAKAIRASRKNATNMLLESRAAGPGAPAADSVTQFSASPDTSQETARRGQDNGDSLAAPGFEESDGRFLSEIEALAYGKSAKSRTCVELGLPESPEAAQAFLLAVGAWDETVNPHPYRAGCALASPKVALGPDLDDLPRVDLTSLRSWAIDNAWSKDPDDAIGWDGSSVWVHVADPASAILPGSAADEEALARGSTLYLPELTAPMLADEALERYGLGLGATSPALSFRIDLAEDGSVSAVEAMASTVRVRRASYGEADALMASGEAPELLALAEPAERRRARRIANGAVEIDIPEVRIRVVGEGKAREIGIERVPRDRSSALVRELMLLAGEAVARWAFERKLPFPYYGQEAPADSGAAAQGEGLSAQFARRRLMRAGMWGPSPSAHRGLGLPFYAQVTSPLRRYQDLLGHMQIRAALAGRPVLDSDELSRRCALAQAASSATRQAERASNEHWRTAYLVRNPGWRGEAVLVGGAGGGAWQAYIPELGLETKLRASPGAGPDDRIPVVLSRVDLAALESSFDESR